MHAGREVTELAFDQLLQPPVDGGDDAALVRPLGEHALDQMRGAKQQLLAPIGLGIEPAPIAVPCRRWWRRCRGLDRARRERVHGIRGDVNVGARTWTPGTAVW